MNFQKQRDPERLLVEARAAELAAKGYPRVTHDQAMDAELLISEAKKNKNKSRLNYEEPSLG